MQPTRWELVSTWSVIRWLAIASAASVPAGVALAVLSGDRGNGLAVPLAVTLTALLYGFASWATMCVKLKDEYMEVRAALPQQYGAVRTVIDNWRANYRAIEEVELLQDGKTVKVTHHPEWSPGRYATYTLSHTVKPVNPDAFVRDLERRVAEATMTRGAEA
jgi:hypothetical protein